MPFAVHGDDDHTEALAEVDLAECLAEDGGVGADHAFDDGTFIHCNGFQPGGDFAVQGDAFDRMCFCHAGWAAGQHESVTDFEFCSFRISGDGDTVAHDFE